MSNYRNGYLSSDNRALTPKQARRTKKKLSRDKVVTQVALDGGPVPRSWNQTKPQGLSGHPGRRRAQLAEIAAIAEEKAIARALRKQAEIEGRVAA